MRITSVSISFKICNVLDFIHYDICTKQQRVLGYNSKVGVSFSSSYHNFSHFWLVRYQIMLVVEELITWSDHPIIIFHTLMLANYSIIITNWCVHQPESTSWMIPWSLMPYHGCTICLFWIMVLSSYFGSTVLFGIPEVKFTLT